MSSAEDESQQTAPPEAPSTAPLEEANEAAPLPELEVIGAGAESASDEALGESAETANEKPRSARERLNSRTRENRPKKKRGGFIALLIIVLLLIGAIGAAVGSLVYLYWYANDDTLDIQGTWYVAGTETPIEITADAIQLTESVAYHYELNTRDKTITLKLGNMTGYGSYRFSLDRSQLVIFDGQADPQTILEANIRWLIQAVFDELQNEPNDVTAGIRRNRTLLMREPGVLPVFDDASSDTPQSTDSSASSDTTEDPQTVWSADEWLNSSSDDGSAGDSSGDSGNSSDPNSSNNSNSSDVNDVDSLFEGINDLPADNAGSPSASDGQVTPEGSTS